MGVKGKEMVEKAGLDVNKLITMLNKDYCDEWLAYCQYWTGARLAVGIPRTSLEAEMEEHANDELDHAKKLAKRIVELGGTPEIDPSNWKKLSSCGYLPPDNPTVDDLLEQNLHSERCAIAVYEKILDYVRGKDMITGHLVRHIMQEEVEHEQELESIREDITTFRQSCGKK